MTTTVAIERTCPQCSRRYRVSGNLAARGGGVLCPWCTKKLLAVKFNRVSGVKTPGRTSKAAPQTGRLTSDDKGATVICARCQQPRGFGQPCPRCEWRVVEGAG